MGQSRHKPHSQQNFIDPRAGPGRSEDRALLHPTEMSGRYAAPLEEYSNQDHTLVSSALSDTSLWSPNTSRPVEPYTIGSMRRIDGDIEDNTLPPLRTLQTGLVCERCRKHHLQVIISISLTVTNTSVLTDTVAV